jgi:trans-aconitate methyltransferase
MNKQWDPDGYQRQCNFVYGYGQQVLDLLGDVAGKRVLDVGSGSGVLSDALAKAGASVIGIDGSAEMVALARSQFPSLDFRHRDVLDLTFREEFDSVFSNAVLHWIGKQDQDRLLSNVSRALKAGGLFVFEMGGAGCAETVHRALSAAFARHGLPYVHPHYFPTIGEYAPMVERSGLVVTDAWLFDRPTEMVGANGFRNWVEMFVATPFAGIEPAMKDRLIDEAEAMARDTLFDGTDWTIDYVRLRMRAEKR